MIVTIENLSHRYTKDWAIKDINLQINTNGVIGLLGSNGAGKSTTMNILCGVLSQTHGVALIDGIDIRKEPEQAKSRLGFLPQNVPLYPDFSVDEYLHYCARLRNVDKVLIKKKVAVAKERCGVAHFSKRLIRNLSGGYRQRVGIAQAIIHQPKLVVLDEPTNGLDPMQIIEVRKLIKEIAQDSAVIFSSHILPEVQLTCERIYMIEKGRLVFADTIHAFNNYIEPNSMLLHLEEPPMPEAFYAIHGVNGVEVLNEKSIRLRFHADSSIAERVIQASVEQGWRLKELTLEKSSLDEIFSQLSNKQVA